MDEQSRVIRGRYRCQRMLGEGGMAEVWLAWDGHRQRPVALKLLRRQYAKEASLLARFRREAQLVAQLDSPRIVQVYDIDTEREPYFIAMEFVDGQDLKEHLLFEAPLPVERALSHLKAIAEGVAIFHAAGLVHRDLKPENIILSRKGALKITDFGIARTMARAGLTEPGTVWGTSHYLSPEQARGEPAMPASDIYSLGVLLFEMLSGRLPFPGDDPVAVAVAHIQQAIPDLQEENPSVPAGVARLVARMMAKAPEARPRNGAALAQILEAYLELAGNATIARPVVGRQAGHTGGEAREGAAPAGHPSPSPAPSREWRRRVSGPVLALLALCVLVSGLGMALVEFPFPLAGGVGPGVAWQDRFAVVTNTPSPTATRPAPTATAVTPTATPSPSPTVPPHRTGNGPDARAQRAGGEPAIRIDGNLSEWRGRGVPVSNPVSGKSNWRGAGDLSGEAFFTWDDTYLYFAVKRFDDHHTIGKAHRGHEMRHGDSVSLWLDVDLIGDYFADVPDKDDVHLGFSPGDFQTIRPEAVRFFPTGESVHRQLRVRAEPLPNGYTLEARIPWAGLGAEPAANRVMGYAVRFNDNDPPVSDEVQKQVAGTLRAHDRDPTRFANLILVP